MVAIVNTLKSLTGSIDASDKVRTLWQEKRPTTKYMSQKIGARLLSKSREQTQAKQFKDIWGFLVSPDPPTSLTRPHAVKTVKYINSHGGTWTVAAQRIPAQNKDDIEADATSTLSASGHLSALAATNMTHSERLDWSHCHNPSFRTTNQKYGQRLPLEQFGVGGRTNTPPFVDPFDLMEQEEKQ